MSSLFNVRRLMVILACLTAIRGSVGTSQAEPLLSGTYVGLGPEVDFIESADFNADGFTDLVGVNRLGQLQVYLGSADLSFNPPAYLTDLSWAVSVSAVADIDGDRKPDLILGTNADLVVLFNTGRGSLGGALPLIPGAVDGLAVGDFDSDGTLDFATSSESASGFAVTVTFMQANDPHHRIAKQVALPPGRGPGSLASADFDGDGDSDLASVNRCDNDPCPHGSVSVYLNEGGGVFAAPRSFAVGVSPSSLETGDFNEDGNADLVTGLSGPGDVSVLLGQGDGSFAEELRVPTGVDVSTGSQVVKIGDWNLDGHQDLAVSGLVPYWSLSSGMGHVAVLDGHGDGTFAPSRIYGASVAGGMGIVAGDFNGDGNPDLATRNNMANFGGIVLLPGDGHGSFAGLQAIRPGGFGGTSGSPTDIASGDFNRDGRRDLIYVDYGLTVLLGGPDGQFTSLRSFGYDHVPHAVAIGDFNQDGIPDLALANFTSDISILPGNGDGTFGSGMTFPIRSYAVDIVVSDFDEDGRDDVAALDIHLSVLRGQGDGTLGAEETYIPSCSYPQSLMLGDFYRDGHTDIAVECLQKIVVFANLVDFISGPFAVEVPTGYFTGMTHADFNGDGNEDLAVLVQSISPNYVYVQVLLGTGDVTFFSTGPALITDGASVGSIAAADFDADGRVDLSVGVHGLFNSPGVTYPSRSRVYLGDGSGAFTPAHTVLTLSSPTQMLAEDLDADERPDLTVGGAGYESFGVSLLVLRNIGPLPDADGDGSLNPNDQCTDTDGDGFGDPGFMSNLCVPDNCGHVPNPSQADSDGDGIGDACDRCTDGDQDEAGDAGFPVDVCPLDNCQGVSNLSQQDLDRDGLGDACDPCTDRDGDGHGEPVDACPEDNCPLASNPDQADADGDRIGDACDPCPADPLNDPDGDRVCDGVDNCPDFNADQADADGDRVGDRCDNCLTVSNQDQLDTNADGSGDACQPSLVLSDIRGDGSGSIEVAVVARDPQGEALSGTVEVIESQAQALTIRDLKASDDCGQGWFPEGDPRAGVGFLFRSAGIPLVMDYYTIVNRLGLVCDVDSLERYSMRAGACGGPENRDYGYEVLTLADLPLPAPICVTNRLDLGSRFDATIQSFDQDSMILSFIQSQVLSVSFDDGLPGQIDISALNIGPDHRLRITVTDGNTVPVSVEAPFDYQGESTMLFGGHAPRAVIAPTGPVECDRLEGGFVTLDGSGSEDPDSTPGTNDDIVRFEWFEDFETVETPLGEGERLTLTLPLGGHAITLRVTDSASSQTTQTVTVEVVDTQGPVIECPVLTSAECAGPEGAFVALSATGRDACGGPVPLANNRTPGGADASGTYPLGPTLVGFSGTDASGNGSSCESRVVVQDTTPPALVIAAEPHVLWPPNHRLVTVGTRWQAVDRCDPLPRVILSGATSSEPDDAAGTEDGVTNADIVGADVGQPDTEMMLRAERSASGPGRTYDLEYSATDASGNRGSALATVLVPHDLGSGPEPLHQRLQTQGIPGRVQVFWSTVENALSYDLIRGSLENLVARVGKVSLGRVRLLLAGQNQTTWSEGQEEQPAAGRVFFYLAQYHDSGGPSGYGTETSSLPLIPDSAPGAAIGSGGDDAHVK